MASDSNRQVVVLSHDKHKPVTLTRTDSGLEVKYGTTKKLIPYHNVLWAEASETALSIDYVSNPTKAHAKVEKKSWNIPSAELAESVKSFATQLFSQAYGKSKPQKRAYVLVNPHSGPGGGDKKWDQHVKPLFEAARMHADAVILKKGGEAIDLVEKMDIDQYDTVVACSGDGTPHEIFNGLAKRPDAAKALSTIAVSHIPCGSGNAMSLNLYGSNKPAVAALGIIKGMVTPLDILSVTQSDRRIVSFLSQAVGIIAECDLGTEHMRWMGAKRFEVGLISRIYQKKCYPCDIAIKLEMDNKDAIKAHYKRQISATKQSGAFENTGLSADGGLPPLKYGTIQDDADEYGWELIPYDKMGNFYCGNMGYMAPDTNFFPAALPSDGLLDMVMIDGDLPTVKATTTLLSVETGKFFDQPQVSYRKVLAYRIIPRDQADGYISIDGERMPFEPFQVEIHPGLGRVLSTNGTLACPGPTGWEKVQISEDGAKENGVNGTAKLLTPTENGH